MVHSSFISPFFSFLTASNSLLVDAGDAVVGLGEVERLVEVVEVVEAVAVGGERGRVSDRASDRLATSGCAV